MDSVPTPPAAAPVPATYGHVPMSVVVVDDDPVISAVLSRRLGQVGVEVTPAADGEAGIAATRAVRPDLVIMDWLMPGMTGLEACTALRADPDPAVAATPVFLVTSRNRPADLEQGYAAGVTDYFVKPLPLRTLVEQVCAVLIRQRAGRRTATS
jgi:two-component system, OmpR family, phosphate regulon response regulator PhoB